MVHSWIAPNQGTYKVDADAAFQGGKLVGLGAVMRDYKGEVVLSTWWHQDQVCLVDVGEAIALRHALSIGLEAGLLNVVCETDSIKLFHHLKRCYFERTAFGNIVHDITELAKQCSSITYSHARRSGNVVAHELAKLAYSFEDMRVWVKEVPEPVSACVLADIAALC